MRLVLTFLVAILAAASGAHGASNADKLAALNHFGEAFDRILEQYYVEPDTATMLSGAYQAMVDQFLPGDAAMKARKFEPGGDVFRGLAEFGDSYELIRERVGGTVSDSDLIAAAISGMLDALDEGNTYYDPVAYRTLQENWRSEFGGIGAQVAKDEDVARIVVPLDGSPAAAAAIMAGDLIVAIDGASTADLTLEAVVGRLRGPIGTPVQLTVRRNGLAEPMEVIVVRDRIQVTPVRSELIDNIGYIRISSLNGAIAEAVEQAVADLKASAKGSPPQGYVLDLRNNTGGRLDQAVAVSDVFVDSGLIVALRNRAGDMERYNANAGVLDLGGPLLVLVNLGTSSAAEIIAAAFQDHRTATIIGGSTRGSGTVNTIFPLGDGAISLITTQFHRPSGEALTRNGVTPDQVVRSDPDVGLSIPDDRLLDRQLQYAIAMITGTPLPAADPKKPRAAEDASGGAPADNGDASFDDLEDLGSLD